MATFKERLKALRTEKGWSQQRLADELEISKSSVNMYERGEREPSFETMEAIADIFNVDMDYLYGRTDVKIANPITPAKPTIPPGFLPMPEMAQVPLVGRIACGTPITAEQNVEQIVSIPAAWRATFTLMCKGDSMAPRIQDGDLVAIRKQPEVENGEIAAVRIGEEATLKHVYRRDGFLELRPENPKYESIILIGEKMAEATIEGKVVGLCRDV